ncbi:cytochrome C [Frankia sp. QA3]|uniref:cytochrome C n=1 Tax=Frankia sp. QA3 TaxID=710111 RepID=UPI001E546067|nr:cytochrome C [Frankia sp. QA3]
MRALGAVAAFCTVLLVGAGVVGRQASADGRWAYVAVVVLAAVAAGLAARLIPGRHHGAVELDCPRCRGEGQAFYGTGRETYRRRCRACHGRGSVRRGRAGAARWPVPEAADDPSAAPAEPAMSTSSTR